MSVSVAVLLLGNIYLFFLFFGIYIRNEMNDIHISISMTYVVARARARASCICINQSIRINIKTLPLESNPPSFQLPPIALESKL